MKKLVVTHNFNTSANKHSAANSAKYSVRDSRFRPVLIASLIANRALRNKACDTRHAKLATERCLKIVSKLNPLMGENPDRPTV